MFWLLENWRFGIGGASGVRIAGTQDFCEAPIHHQHFAEWADHDVCGFQVAVQNAARMGECDGVADTQENSQAVRNRSNRLYVPVETAAFNEFHGVEDAAIGERSHVVNGHDAGMLESGQHASFTNKTIGEIAVCSRNFEDFQGHAPLEILVLHGVDNTHAAARNTIQQAITCASEIGDFRAFAQTFEGAVGEKLHLASEPKAARASR